MLFLTILKVALKSLQANKMRTLLAMLGIIIGVGAVISMLAMGAGAQQQVIERVSAMGTDLLIVRPAQSGPGGVRTGTAQTLTLADAEAILQSVDHVKAVAPVVTGSVQAKHLNRNSRTTVLGSSVTYFSVRGFAVEKGRSFTETEAERMARVAVIGPATAEALFGVDDPLEQTVKLNGLNFRVIGVLKSKGDQGYFNPDDQIMVPYTSAMQQLFGVDKLREIDVQAVQDADLDKVQNDVTELLRKRHRTQPGMDNDFEIRNQAEILETASSVSRTFTVLLGGIASISLLVGGIGIMNIMLVTVTERTREIGVRKAIGAKERDILRQFLFESVLLSGIGGVLGVALGIGAASLIESLTDFRTVIQVSSGLLSLSFSAAVGVFFGYYPARRAARLDPIEALRYE